MTRHLTACVTVKHTGHSCGSVGCLAIKMTDYSVIRFLDEILGRIAPTELVKLLNRKKFVPTSAKDLPEGNVNVKWQKSFNTSSFSEDGYFEAEIFALAGKLILSRPLN